MAAGLAEEGARPALLNMANEAAAGGGWLSGAAAQEEDLFRRSDYHLRVDPQHYPIPEHGCVYLRLPLPTILQCGLGKKGSASVYYETRENASKATVYF